MKDEIVTVTPHLARQWLSTSPLPLRRGARQRIEKLAQSMREGMWDTTSAITFKNGILVDGHHRLQACVEYGLTFTTTVRQQKQEH